jgi:hypothetical protein
MESLALQNKRCADPVMHLLLSWRENENPTREQVREAVNITLDEMNLSGRDEPGQRSTVVCCLESSKRTDIFMRRKT